MRGALAATAVATAVGITSAPAIADPAPPSNANDAANQLHQLSSQAEVLTNQFQKAQDDHNARLGDLARANAEAGHAQEVANQARTEEEKFRGQVDRLTHASFQGARMNQLSELLVSKSPTDYLDRASALDILSKDQDDVLKRFTSATQQANAAEQQAQDARNRAQQAEADAARILNDLQQKKAAMDAQVAKANDFYQSLSAKEKKAISGTDDTVGALAGSGAAIQAVNSALSKVGDPYVWGATGPNQFDCSGLVQWAYRQAGISLPRSTYSQVGVGRSVSQSNLQPGDLIFFNGEEHVGIYVGGGKVVHAPTEGENVKVTPYQYIGSVDAIRRVAG